MAYRYKLFWKFPLNVESIERQSIVAQANGRSNSIRRLIYVELIEALVLGTFEHSMSECPKSSAQLMLFAFSFLFQHNIHFQEDDLAIWNISINFVLSLSPRRNRKMIDDENVYYKTHINRIINRERNCKGSYKHKRNGNSTKKTWIAEHEL